MEMIKFIYGVFDSNLSGYSINWSSEVIDESLKKELIRSFGDIGLFNDKCLNSDSHYYFNANNENRILAKFNFNSIDKIGRLNCKSALGVIEKTSDLDSKIFNFFEKLEDFELTNIFNDKVLEIDLSTIREDDTNNEYINKNKERLQVIISNIIANNKVVLKYDSDSKKMIKSVWDLLRYTEFQLKNFTTYINTYDEYNYFQLSAKIGCQTDYIIGNNIVSKEIISKTNLIIDNLSQSKVKKEFKNEKVNSEIIIPENKKQKKKGELSEIDHIEDNFDELFPDSLQDYTNYLEFDSEQSDINKEIKVRKVHKLWIRVKNIFKRKRNEG